MSSPADSIAYPLDHPETARRAIEEARKYLKNKSGGKTSSVMIRNLITCLEAQINRGANG